MNNFDNLSIKDIRILSNLPTIKSIRSFAEQQGQTPAAISKRIKYLEDNLQHKLLSRSTLGVTVTEDGYHYSLWAREVINKLNDRSALSPYEINQKDTLTLGTRGFLNKALAPVFIDALSINSFVNFIDLSPQDTLSLSRSSQIDMAITINDQNFGENWTSISIGKLTWSLMTNSEFNIPPTITVNELKNHELVFATYFDGTTIIKGEDFLQVPQFYKKYGHGVQSAATAVSIALTSDSLIYVPQLAAENELLEGKLKIIHVESLPETQHELFFHINMDCLTNKTYLKLVELLRAKTTSFH